MIEKLLQKNEEIINYLYSFNKYFIILISSFFAFNIRIDYSQFYEYLKVTITFVLIQLLLENFFFSKNKFYQKKIKLFFFKDIYSLFLSILILIFLSAIFKITNYYSRLWLLMFMLFSVSFLTIHKFLFNYIYEKLITSNLLSKNVLLVGNFLDCKELIKKFSKDNKFHFRACIFIDKSSERKFFPIQEVNFKDLNHSILYHKISQIWIIASEDINRNKIMENLNYLPIDIRTVHLNDNYLDHFLENINGYNIYETSLSPFFGFNYLMKLIIDYLLGIVFLLFSIPIIIIFALLIYIEDGFPVFFIQKRHGWDGNIINIIKLRSLKNTKNNDQITKNDNRLLKIGKIIRRLSIDELPQFFNVLKGDMSIVGPRPHFIEHNDKFSKQIKGFMKRHKCKPGVTGLAQIKGNRGNIDSKEKLIKRYENDMLYIKKWSPMLDLWIILKTILIFLFHKAH